MFRVMAMVSHAANHLRTSIEPALAQSVSVDGLQVVSVVRSGDAQFRFVLETLVHEPASEIVGEYEFWHETYRSGIYGSLDEAMTAAANESSWIVARGWSHL